MVKNEPVATNRILLLLSWLRMRLEGGRGLERITLMSVKRTKRGWHVQLELKDVFPTLSQQRQTAKPQHLTTKSARHENEGCRSQATSWPRDSNGRTLTLHDENAATIAKQQTQHKTCGRKMSKL